MPTLEVTSSPPPISQPASTKRKRPKDTDELEDVRPSKQLKELPTSDLSEANLRLFNKEMNASDSSSRPGSNKRSSSRQSVSASEKTKTSSSSTNHRYRHEVLKAHQINIHAAAPSNQIHNAIRAIVGAPPPPRRQEQLEPIVQKFLARCIETAEAAVTENEFVKILHDAISLMKLDGLSLRTNADSKAAGQQQQVDDSAPPPSKRYQQATSQPSSPTQPSTAGIPNHPSANRPQEPNEIPPPTTIPAKERTIKTPGPDITMGIPIKALLSTLSSQGLSKVKAAKFLAALRKVQEKNELSGQQ
ncbi:MAG: hypothetical protein Q9225_007910 [Loekoesia sp. 1 TL-2023]